MSALAAWLSQQNLWEWLAIGLAVAYLWLIIKEHSAAWYCAFLSTTIYTLLFWNVSLLMDSALNVYYMGMAVYGWWQWRYGGTNEQGVHVHIWPLRVHCVWLLVIAGATLISGWLLAKNTSAARPFLDSFTTWAAVFTTYLVARKVLENWLYWIVINTVSVGLYIDRGLYPTAVLFLWYVGMSVYGYYQWLQAYRAQTIQVNEENLAEAS